MEQENQNLENQEEENNNLISISFGADPDCSHLFDVGSHLTNSHLDVYYGYFLPGTTKIPPDKISYEYIKQEYPQSTAVNFTEDISLALSQLLGVITSRLESADSTYDIYRREYSRFDDGTEFKGEWAPVVLQTQLLNFYDYNVQSGKDYQYICYPHDTSFVEKLANDGKEVNVKWRYWSLAELLPVRHTKSTNEYFANNKIKEYTVNEENLWYFKYNLDAGVQTQNISRNEHQTLGQYMKISDGLLNHISGSVSCFLGSEIVPYQEGYIERLRASKICPLSTNEKNAMLQAWRKLVFSSNPKLLKDNTGQAWIVHLSNSNNTPQTHIPNIPDMISFSWREIEDVSNAIIYGVLSEGHEQLESDSRVRKKK